jgi:tetratricopeptide (TPR) repeat protein
LGSLRRRVDAILAKHPDNAVALSLHGEILIDEGKRDQAIDVLRRSYRQTRGARTGWLLRESLLEGLAEDFDKYQADRAEIEQLCKDKRHLARYLRTMAEGLEGLGEWDAALDAYLRLADLPEGDAVDIWLSGSHKVRLDCWLRVRLAAFQNSASAAARRRLNDEAKARLQAARAALVSSDLDTMRRFLEQFAHHPVAVEGRASFVNQLVGSGNLSGGNLIEAEMLLRQEARSKDRAVGGRATARLAEVLRKAGRLEDAAGCYRRLAFEFTDVACIGGMTGKEVVERLPKDDAVRRWFQPDKSWPLGVVEVTETFLKTKPRTRSRRYLTDLNFHGSRQPFFGNRQLKFESGKNIVTSVGAYGNLLWQHPLAGSNSQTRFQINQNDEHISARGHLLVLASAGKQYVAIDCIDPRRPRVLWRHQPEQTLSGLSNVGQANIQAFWAGMQPPRGTFGRSGRHPWQTCILTDQYMCYQKFRGVVALDPLSGRELWTSGDLPKDCTLFGDEHLLFAAPLDSTEATVLRGVDGQKLKTVTVPQRSERLATIGRLVLVWRIEGNRRIVEMVDPWKGRTVWGPYSFEALAKCHLVGNEALGVMEPSGRFTLLSLSDGKKKIETQLQAEPHLLEIVLLEADGEYFLVIHSTARRRGGHTPRPIRGLSSRLIRQGRVYGFDRNGERLWPDFPQGVEVEQQQLLLSQPSRLPVLTFACTEYNSNNPNNRASRWHTSVLMIDKRNGRVLLDRKFKQQASGFELSGDPAGNTVDLHMQHGNLRLAFTGKPLPPVEKKLPVKVKPAGTLDGVLKAFEKVTKQIPGMMSM